jgi:hypothetical protein
MFIREGFFFGFIEFLKSSESESSICGEECRIKLGTSTTYQQAWAPQQPTNKPFYFT